MRADRPIFSTSKIYSQFEGFWAPIMYFSPKKYYIRTVFTRRIHFSHFQTALTTGNTRKTTIYAFFDPICGNQSDSSEILKILEFVAVCALKPAVKG